MLKPFTLLIATLCLLCACNDDDTTMPAYQFALADMSTNIHGTATQLNFDDGNTYQLKAAVTKLKPDTTYRMQVLYVMNDDGKAQLYNYVPILAPQVVRYSTGMASRFINSYTNAMAELVDKLMSQQVSLPRFLFLTILT